MLLTASFRLYLQYRYVSACRYVHMSAGQCAQARGVGSLGAGVRVRFDPSGMGARNQTVYSAKAVCADY